MPNWLIKSALQHIVAAMPYRQRWNELFQRLGTRSLTMGPDMFGIRLDHASTHLENFLSVQGEIPKPFSVLELGTGWHPTIAMGLYLCGADKIWMIDIDPLIRTPQLKRMMELFCEFQANGKLRKHLPRLREDRAARLPELANIVGKEPPEAFLARFGAQVMVRDAQLTGLPARSIDLFFSTGVLEYIPRPVLHGIFKEFLRLSTPSAVMSHWISLIDQFSYFDRSIGPYNYLRYTCRQWRYLNSPLIWQSRLRISDYRKALIDAGYQIVSEQDTTTSMDEFKKIRLAPEFQQYSWKTTSY
jgi:hypothetical protein